jgi:hypothetical protein
MPMPTIQFKLKLFRGDWDQARSQVALLWLMEALVRQNQSHIRQFVSLAKRGIIKEPYPRLYRAGVHYEREPPGQEVWPDVPTILETKDGEFSGPWGDCLPVSTLVAKYNDKGDAQMFPFGSLKIGDVIVEGGPSQIAPTGRTMVLEFAETGEKEIIAFRLAHPYGTPRTLRCSPEHKLFLLEGEKEVRAKNVRPGDQLLGGSNGKYGGLKVIEITTPGKERCADIKTASGRFWLPESDAIVHNCEDLACWRTAELRELGNIKAKPFAKWRFGKSGNYHYHALTLLPDGRLEDPSLTLGMGREAFFAKHDIVDRYKKGELKPLVMFAKLPDVIVVDPEKPTGYSGGKADYYQQGVSGTGARPDELAAWGYDHNDVRGADMAALRDMTSGMSRVDHMGSFSAMTQLPDISTADIVMGGARHKIVSKHEREVDDDGNTLDAMIGWNGKTFVPRSDAEAMRRLMGYGAGGGR